METSQAYAMLALAMHGREASPVVVNYFRYFITTISVYHVPSVLSLLPYSSCNVVKRRAESPHTNSSRALSLARARRLCAQISSFIFIFLVFVAFTRSRRSMYLLELTAGAETPDIIAAYVRPLFLSPSFHYISLFYTLGMTYTLELASFYLWRDFA